MNSSGSTPIDAEVVKKKLEESGIRDMGRAAIREIVRIVNEIEEETGQRYIRMEMGVPGLPTPDVGIEGQISALEMGVGSKYSMIDGLPKLKEEASRFAKLFMDIDIDPAGCVPTVGSMEAGFASFLTLNRMTKGKHKTLFLDPGFPAQKMQLQALGMEYSGFDFAENRGEKLEEKLEQYLSSGEYATLLYSNPNNPTWLCLNDKELEIIARVCKKYGVVVIEDLAYFGMDFRRDYSKPGEPPYQPTIAKYSDTYIIMLSTSKAFSYAGERTAVMMISDALYNSRHDSLETYYHTDLFGKAVIYNILYDMTAGTSHSAQYGVAAMLKAANDGKCNFLEQVREYAERAQIMKKYLTDNGFTLVYNDDDGKPLGDGFYFTFGYPGMTGGELVRELLYYGISAISLAITGAERADGLRACVSQFDIREQEELLGERLRQFREDHPAS